MKNLISTIFLNHTYYKMPLIKIVQSRLLRRLTFVTGHIVWSWNPPTFTT